MNIGFKKDWLDYAKQSFETELLPDLRDLVLSFVPACDCLCHCQVSFLFLQCGTLEECADANCESSHTVILPDPSMYATMSGMCDVHFEAKFVHHNGGCYATCELVFKNKTTLIYAIKTPGFIAFHGIGEVQPDDPPYVLITAFKTKSHVENARFRIRSRYMQSRLRALLHSMDVENTRFRIRPLEQTEK
jgi:hypothetical protein